MKKIRIYTSFHKDCHLIKSDIIQPIHVGAAKSSFTFPGMLRDDAGENISDKNGMYCELTAQYWVWKHVKADYYGFMHYRRYFNFGVQKLEEDCYGNIVMDAVTQKNLDSLNITDDQIQAVVDGNDVITVTPSQIGNLGHGKTVYEDYANSPDHNVKDLDLVVQIIAEKYPEYMKAARAYLRGSRGYHCNMYILSKEVFNSYNAWLFDILAEHEKRADFSNYSLNAYRVSGFLAERLWGIYYTWLRQNRKDLKYLELQKCIFRNTDSRNTEMYPAFAKNNIPVVLAADDKYVPYVTVMIRSMVENSKPGNNYDVVILHSGITPDHQAMLRSEFGAAKNFSIRFVRADVLFEQIELPTHFHITKETYYRLLMKDIMVGYDKVLYLDSDLVVLDDVADLYSTELGDNLLGAVIDVDMAAQINLKEPIRLQNMKKIGLQDPFRYFNAGVLVMNLAQFRKQYTTQGILDVVSSQEWLYMDQDILNHMCNGKFTTLDPSWNVVMNWKTAADCRMNYFVNAPRQMLLDYKASRKAPKIAHYAGFQKPWDIPDCDMAEFFWMYARKTRVYETLLWSRCVPADNSTVSQIVSQDPSDPYLIHIKGIHEPVYVDGFYIKFINKMNKWFPKGSKKRAFLKKLFRKM